MRKISEKANKEILKAVEDMSEYRYELSEMYIKSVIDSIVKNDTEAKKEFVIISNVEISKIVESKGYSFQAALENIDSERDPLDEMRPIIFTEIIKLVDSLIMGEKIDTETREWQKEQENELIRSYLLQPAC